MPVETKHVFVATNICRDVFCRDKHMFMQKFCRDKMILVAAPAADIRRLQQLCGTKSQRQCPEKQLSGFCSVAQYRFCSVAQYRFCSVAQYRFCSVAHPSLLLSWCFTSTETIRLIRDGKRGGGGGQVPISSSSQRSDPQGPKRPPAAPPEQHC